MNEDIRPRTQIIRACFWLAGGVLIWRLVLLMVALHPHYAQAVEEQIKERVEISAKRGIIYDRHGTTVATNISTLRVELDLAMARSTAKIARQLSALLPFSEHELAEEITKQITKWRSGDADRVQTLAFDLPAREGLEEELGAIKGVRVAKTFDRAYVFGALLSQPVGYVNVDEVGLDGVERDYDEELRGEPGEVLVQKTGIGSLPVAVLGEGAKGRFPLVPREAEVIREARHGSSLYLTLDVNIQRIVKDAAARAYQRLKCKAVTAIVIDPQWGDILAMVTHPSFDPQAPIASTAGKQERMRNLALWWRYEPGSTFKPFIVAAGLNENKVSGHNSYYCEGYRKHGRRKINCWTVNRGHSPHHHLNLSDAVIYSCNVAMTYVIEQLGQNNFEKYFQRFGFDRALLPRCAGESKGGLRQRAPFSSGDFLRFGFGQGFTVTPLELATAYCAFANGGKLIRPRLVRKVVEYETGETTVFPPEVIQQVISPQVAKEVLGYLELVIEQGTGKNVALKGVRIAGKTGTAQKAIPGKGYVPGKKVTSFAAIVPVEAPKYVILVVIDEPKTARSGAASAGPVVKEIIQQLLARENNQLRAAASVAGT